MSPEEAERGGVQRRDDDRGIDPRGGGRVSCVGVRGGLSRTVTSPEPHSQSGNLVGRDPLRVVRSRRFDSEVERRSENENPKFFRL